MKAVWDSGAAERELEQVDKALARVEKGRAALLDALSSGVLDLDADTKARLADLKRQRDKLLKRKKELERMLGGSRFAQGRAEDLYQLARTVLDRIDLLSEEERREVVRALVSRIVVQKEEKGVVFTLYLNLPGTVSVALDVARD